MTNLIVTTSDELKRIVGEAVASALPQSVEPKSLPETLNLDGAITLLEEHGYTTSRATIYKLTSRGELPHSKYGNKLIFSRSELLQWADNQSVKVSTNAEKVEELESCFRSRRR